MYGLRFLIGFFEGATWPGYFTIIRYVSECSLQVVNTTNDNDQSQWYLPHEMALRMSLYNMAQPVGAMLSGAMQGAMSTNLEGVMGRSGWRWAFIINVCLALLYARVLMTEREIFWIGRLHNLHRFVGLHHITWLCEKPQLF